MASLNKLAAALERPATQTLLNFIRAYRLLERSSYESSKLIFKKAFYPTSFETKDVKQKVKYIHDQWRVKEKGFGQFFLNKLSRSKMINLLNYWGITDSADTDYLQGCASSAIYYIQNSEPDTCKQIFRMVLFFENHGIDENPIEGMNLTNLPDAKRRFGNSSNWADYILTLADPDQFFDDLFTYYTN